MSKERSRIEESAYRWVGSAPCEDCHKFSTCNENGNFSCERRKEWDKDYENMINVFEKLYENKDK